MNSLAELNDASLTIVMSFCGEGGAPYLPIAQRLLNHVESTKLSNHFAFDLR